MNVPQLLDELRRQVPLGASFGTRWKGVSEVRTAQGAHQVAMAARIDAKGQRREQFWCDGVRVELPVLLRLTCPEGECPQARQVRAQWVRFHRPGAAADRPRPPSPQPLAAEVAVTVGQQCFTARAARFPCFTPCPHRAHPPLTIDKTGFDLFDDSICLGGGVTESRGVRRPRIPSVRAAEAYVLARYLETLAALGQARDAHPGRAGPASEAD